MAQYDRHGNEINPAGSRMDYLISTARNEKSEPGANVAELEKLEAKLGNLKIENPGKYYALDKALKDGTGKDDRLAEIITAPGRPDAVNRHIQQLIDNPGNADAIIKNMERDAATSKPSATVNKTPAAVAAAPAKPEAPAASSQSFVASENTPKVSIPADVVRQSPGAATTVGAVAGVDVEVPQAGAPAGGAAGGGMQNMMASLSNIMPQLGQMLQEIFGKLMGAFGGSKSLMDQGNNNMLAQKAMDMTGSNAKLTSIDPQSGRVLEPNAPKPELAQEERPQVAGPRAQGLSVG